MTHIPTHRLLAAVAAFAALNAVAANHEVTVSPVANGPFAVACSNVEQDEAIIARFDTSPEDFWEGRPNAGQSRYINQILAAPGTAVRFDARAPDNHLYPQTRGQAVPHVALVCHPTPAANADPDYILPETGGRVPRMQPRWAAPKLIGAAEYARAFSAPIAAPPPSGPARLPFIVFSHGLGGSPISSDYLEALVDLASHGFVVGAVFHGDPRFSRIHIDDIDDYFYLLTDYEKFAEMQLLRPLALSALVDRLLADPGFSPGIDAARIGGFGTSLGGQAIANLLGAKLTTSIGKDCNPTARDARVKAAVGLLPYAGQTFLPSFCDDQSGAEELMRPYLAIAGTVDTTAPIGMVRQAVNRFAGSRYLVELVGRGHGFGPEVRGDVFTWMVTFLNAYLGVEADPGAMGRLIRMARVAGGAPDVLTIDRHVPSAGAGSDVPILEFHNTVVDHYFIAGGADEIAILTHPEQLARGWRLTGHAFKGWMQLPSDTFTPLAPVCRFYGAPAGGPNSHFFTAEPDECAAVKAARGWFYEGIGFYIRRVDAALRCPEGWLAVNRAYNNAQRGESNHRYVTSDSEWRLMQPLGWTLEGAVMCARP